MAPSTKPDAPAPAPDSASPPDRAPTATAPAGVVAEYVLEQERVYHFPGAPITARQGDVALLPFLPGDGAWVATNKIVTRLPDNHPDNQPQSPDPEQVAHSLAEREEIMAALGLLKPQVDGGDQS